jgi:pilus assembly protein CpaE
MKKRRKVLIAGAGRDLRELLDEIAADMPDIDFEGAPSVALRALNGTAVASAALVVEIDLSAPSAIESFEHLTGSMTERKVIAAARNAAVADVRGLFRAGAADVLTTPFTGEALRLALAEVLETGPRKSADIGRVISILKTGGGVGATTLAVNLAVCSAGGGRQKGGKPAFSTALLDLDLQFGDAEIALNLEPRSTVVEVLRAEQRFDARFLQSAMVEHASGLKLLASPPKLIPLDGLPPNLAAEIVEQSARLYDRTFVDLPSAWTDWSLPILKRSDLLVLVSAPTVQGARGARRTLDALREAGIDAPVLFVLNKLAGMVEAFERPSRIGRSLDRPVDAALGFDANASRALDRGSPVLEAFPSARLSREIRGLAAKIEQSFGAEPTTRLPLSGAAA